MDTFKILFCVALLVSVTTAKEGWVESALAFFNLGPKKKLAEKIQVPGMECNVPTPQKPNFMVPGRSISASKCAEYLWIRKQKEIEAKIMEICEIKTETATIPTDLLFLLDGPAIVGGRNARKWEFPHMGALGWKSSDTDVPWIFKCGSTLISENFVLTAGHCTQIPLRYDPEITDPKPKIVRFGVENIDQDAYHENGDPIDVNIKRIIVHPNYAPPRRYYDIALLELENNVKFDLNVLPACLSNDPNSFIGSTVAVTGWGYTENGYVSDFLQVANVEILDTQLCDRLLYKKRNRHWQGFEDSQMCAGNLTGGVDTCQGDSGGPIQMKMDNGTEGPVHMVLGVTSFGIKCALTNLPGIYTRVSSFIPWIESVVWGHLISH